ncbi:MAG: hypothetical protein LBM60_04590, partial [Clostridium sp.]|nr:hypothetical protein [Clostridium sp.]
MKRVQKMSGTQRLIRALTVFLLGIVLLCACGKKDENLQLAKDQVFRFENLPYEIGQEEIVGNMQIYRNVAAIDFLNNKICLLINVNEYPVYNEGDSGEIIPLDDFVILEDFSTEDPSAEDPSTEDPSVEDPSVEDSSAEDISTEEPATEDPVVKDPDIIDKPADPILPVDPNQPQPRNYYELVTFDADGSNMQIMELESTQSLTDSEYSYMGYTDFAPNGDMYATLSFSAPSDDNSDIWVEKTYICRFSAQDGSLVWANEIEGITPDYEKGEYFYLSMMTCLDNGQIGLVFDGSVRMILYFSEQGELISREDIDTGSMDNIYQIFFKPDGTILLTGYSSSDNTYPAYTYDPKTKKMGDPINLPFQYYNYSIYQAPTALGADFILSNAVGLYTYTLGDAEIKPLMNFVNSDFPSSYLYQFAFLDQETFVAMYYDEDNYSQASAIFHYVDPAEIPDKKVLILGVNGYWGRISTMVREFNKTNEEYRIVLRDYSQYNTDEDYMAGYSKLNNDILAGDIPDIISIADAMPIDSYISQGLFLDWRPLYEADEDFKDVELMDTIISTISGGDKWYLLFPEFSVQTVIGREEFVGTPQDWSLDKFLSLAKADPERQMFAEMTQYYFLSQAMAYCGNDFIDP